MKKKNSLLKKTILMCRPDHFLVNYEINPWMTGNIGQTKKILAKKQWNFFLKTISSKANIKLITPDPDLPDMVFTANAAIVVNRDVILARFSHNQRKKEEPQFSKWFKDQKYNIYTIPEHLFFEGAGDALFDESRNCIWAGYGVRTSLESHAFIANILKIEVLSLRLIDQRFYHLDTCFVPLPKGYILYFPNAFDTYSNKIIEKKVPANKRIKITNEEALSFTANSIIVEDFIIVNHCSLRLKKILTSIGLKIIMTPFSEFMKAGGAAKCLTLCLNETGVKKNNLKTKVSTRTIISKGQLIDTNILSKICDSIVNGGGSFRINKIQFGVKKTEPSTAEIEMTAPDKHILEQLTQKVCRLGGSIPVAEAKEAQLEKVTQNGVAPENFYSTTIYPTQIKIGEQWLDVKNQRMDGVITVSKKTAICKLVRDLKINEYIATGINGVRIKQFSRSHEHRGQFCFMGSGISSERKVEVSIEQIAWEMIRIKKNNTRLVVVSGPVVIHTGGGAHLAWLIKKGFISALLGGNAIAVHDIEQAIFGTSLGVDIKTGHPVERGHRNHIAAINKIRRDGSISKAVKNATLNSGIFYELVKNKIPYSLAGSIRDDGPMPDTQMNLIKAQEDYARLIKGCDMILMLSSMLHSIGTGNMTPAGVKLVCVDINPAVITKLTDRGSLESTGVVTDVGLFLSLLVKKLRLLIENT